MSSPATNLAGSMALGMLCAMYANDKLPPELVPVAREVLRLSGDLVRLDEARLERKAAEIVEASNRG